MGTRQLGKPHSFAGDPQRFPDCRFKFKAYLGAIDPRYQAMIAVTEQSTTPILNVGMTADEARLSTQLYNALVMLSSGAVLDMRHNNCVNEGFETWRNFAM